MDPEVVTIMLTYNRHLLLERAIGSFIDQDYEGKHTLIVYNTGVPVIFSNPSLPPNKEIKFYNNDKDYKTREDYICVGDKFRDALSIAPKVDIITHMDDDDYMLPNHISEGVRGLNKFPLKYEAYKPQKSWFRSDLKTLTLASNVMENSIFIYRDFLIKHPYSSVSAKCHFGWIDVLLKENMLFEDAEGLPTLVYDWSGEQIAYRLSGRGIDDDSNFVASQNFPDNYNDGLVTPLSHEQMIPYYQLVEDSSEKPLEALPL